MLKGPIYAATLAGMTALTIPATQYLDMPGFSNKHQLGRTKNAVATILGGVVGQEICQNRRSDVRLNIGKTFFPDAQVIGSTTGSTISTTTQLSFTSSDFQANGNMSNGNLQGELSKSEFNWNLKQAEATRLHIGRFGLKFDNTLDLDVDGGIIEGTHTRGPISFNWNIDGEYSTTNDKDYDINMHVNIPFGGDLDIDGKVSCE